jgi:predicted nucleotidyltransferase
MPLTDRLRRLLEPLHQVRLAVLFGSAARGDDSSESDLDLAVLLDADAPEQLWDIEVAVAEATGRTVDLVDVRRAPPLLRFEIARDGAVVAERQAGDWSRFVARAMLDWWDWAPTARRMARVNAECLRREVASEEAGDGPT